MSLLFERNDNNASGFLWGDLSTLMDIHTFIISISDRSPTLNDEGQAMSLAYEIRKAYSGMRESRKITLKEDKITMYGFEFNWVLFIAQVALLRTALAYVNTSKQDQYIMYLIDNFLYKAIEKEFPNKSTKILKSYESLIGIQEKTGLDNFSDPLVDNLGSKISYFLSLSDKEQSVELAKIIDSINYSKPRGKFADHSWETISENAVL